MVLIESVTLLSQFHTRMLNFNFNRLCFDSAVLLNGVSDKGTVQSGRPD